MQCNLCLPQGLCLLSCGVQTPELAGWCLGLTPRAHPWDWGCSSLNWVMLDASRALPACGDGKGRRQLQKSLGLLILQSSTEMFPVPSQQSWEEDEAEWSGAEGGGLFSETSHSTRLAQPCQRRSPHVGSLLLREDAELLLCAVLFPPGFLA